MEKEKRLVELYRKDKEELNRITNYLLSNSPVLKAKKKILVVSLLILVICLILIIASIGLLLTKAPVYNVKNYYPVEVKEYYPTTQVTKTVHLEPEYVEECIKLREINSDVWQMRCRKK